MSITDLVKLRNEIVVPGIRAFGGWYSVTSVATKHAAMLFANPATTGPRYLGISFTDFAGATGDVQSAIVNLSEVNSLYQWTGASYATQAVRPPAPLGGDVNGDTDARFTVHLHRVDATPLDPALWSEPGATGTGPKTVAWRYPKTIESRSPWSCESALVPRGCGFMVVAASVGVFTINADVTFVEID